MDALDPFSPRSVPWASTVVITLLKCYKKQLQQVMEQVGSARVRDLRDHLIAESVPV